MIGYITLGTNDLEKAGRFYDALLNEIGATRFMESDRFIAWSFSRDKTGLSLINPYDGNAATVGNGVMVAIETRDQLWYNLMPIQNYISM